MEKEKNTTAVERLDIENTKDLAQIFMHKQRFDFALQRISPADSALEIGIGTGYFSKILASHCQNYTGLEIDPASCAEVRKKLQGKGVIVEGDAHALPFSDKSYSAVVVLEVLEHLTDYRRAVQEIHRCMAPSGRVIISVPYRRRGGTSEANPFHIYEPGEGELVETFQKYFGKIEVMYQYFQETAIMTLARVLHLRRVLGLAQRYADMTYGVPAALEKVKIDGEGKGLRMTLVLVASERKETV